RHHLLSVARERRDGHRRGGVRVLGALRTVDTPALGDVDAIAEASRAGRPDWRAELRAPAHGVQLTDTERDAMPAATALRVGHARRDRADVVARREEARTTVSALRVRRARR